MWVRVPRLSMSAITAGRPLPKQPMGRHPHSSYAKFPTESGSHEPSQPEATQMISAIDWDSEEIWDEEDVAGVHIVEEKENDAVPPVHVKECRCIGQAVHPSAAAEMMIRELRTRFDDVSRYQSGIIRMEVHLPGGGSALNWLKHQSKLLRRTTSFYFRPRYESSFDVDGSEQIHKETFAFSAVGSCWTWKGQDGEPPDARLFDEINSFLDTAWPSIRCMGGTRFDAERQPGTEWAGFGSYLFFVPALEYHEGPGQDTLACTVAWNRLLLMDKNCHGVGCSSLKGSVDSAVGLLKQLAPLTSITSLTPNVGWYSAENIPEKDEWKETLETANDRLCSVKHIGDLSGGLEQDSAMQEYMEAGQQGLDALLMTMQMSTEVESHDEDGHQESLSKVVLARRTDLHLKETVNPHVVLQQLQERDATSYQFCLGLQSGDTFVGSTPERLYTRAKRQVCTEAIAATRPRGPKGNLEKDFMIGLEMLRNPKDHVEFTLVRDWLTEALRSICSGVHVDVHKSIVRKPAVQHLYGRLSGSLKELQSDLDILNVLHPTPAVCGRPQRESKKALSEMESFDRGYYAGPIGWISGTSAEFVVAIRSGLIRRTVEEQHKISLYAGVGLVKESNPESEWNELDLKIQPFVHLLTPSPSPLDASDINGRTAALLVEELCRSGVKTFAIAPGSRSSPLVYAVATNPNCHVFPCIDERCLGFWSVGFGRASGRPAAIITSSGTAVANLLPAVIEANLSHVPLLLLTADRPSELRHTGANQTIDQVNIFGDNTRYFHDIPPPAECATGGRLRALLTMVDAAVRHCCMHPAGPVHLNFQFNEPLAPTSDASSDSFPSDGVLDYWWKSKNSFTKRTYDSMTVQWSDNNPLITTLQARRGLLVIGEILDPVDRMAVLDVANRLEWPCVVDVLSGIKSKLFNEATCVISTADQILGNRPSLWETLRPDVILQMGGHLTSKRLVKFLEHCRLSSPWVQWIAVSPDGQRDDPQHLVTEHVNLSFSSFQQFFSTSDWSTSAHKQRDAYLQCWKLVDHSVQQSLKRNLLLLGSGNELTEPYVSFLVSQLIPEGHGIFLGNGMPIRDMNSFGGLSNGGAPSDEGAFVQNIAANRGASGIDGVVSTSIGYAVGLRRPTTLLIGDVSFFHDSNGLTLLRSEVWPPITIIIINNRGGGIFDFLPIADAVPTDMLESLWSTPQYVNIGTLSQAYGIAHNCVTKPDQLRGALSAAWSSHQHSIVEVMTDRSGNVALHKGLLNSAAAVAVRSAELSKGCAALGDCEIADLSWQTFSVPLAKALTSHSSAAVREGILLRVTLKTATGEWEGVGEIAPLEGMHSESLDQALPQLRYMRKVFCGRVVPWEVCLLNGSLDNWLRGAFGLKDNTLSPSVRFGLDAALLTGMSLMQGRQIHNLCIPSCPSSGRVSVNAMLGSQSNVETAIAACGALTQQGYCTVKIKVGRNPDPETDAQIINAIVDSFGDQVKIRLDANRAWSLEQALTFAESLRCPDLEYIEEPVADPNDLVQFHRMTQLPIGLDETLDDLDTSHEMIQTLLKCEGVVCCVLKPSRIGSIDQAVSMMEVCAFQKRKVVISSSFESPIGLSILTELAAISDDIMHHSNGVAKGSVHHGLGTLQWFDLESISPSAVSCFSSPSIPLSFSQKEREISIQTHKAELPLEDGLQFQKVVGGKGEYTFAFRAVGRDNVLKKKVLVFLHGFLGDSSDWLPVMHFLSHKFHCIAIDLPGHGCTTVSAVNGSYVTHMYGFQNVTDALRKLLLRLKIVPDGVIGYSLGGRLVQNLALQLNPLTKLIIASASTGIEDPQKRADRFRQDLDTASVLSSTSTIDAFLNRWYEGSQHWTQLRKNRPMYHALLKSRSQGANVTELSKALVGMSTGRMKPLAESLAASDLIHVYFLYGGEDVKFRELMNALSIRFPNRFSFACLEGCSHALPTEAGYQIALAILRIF